MIDKIVFEQKKNKKNRFYRRSNRGSKERENFINFVLKLDMQVE
jgi:hypothetical protein